jgi:hypothetical protein
VTKAKAASVAAALVNAGYFPVVELLTSGQYQVTASLDTGIDLAIAKSFMDAQAVAGVSNSVQFV